MKFWQKIALGVVVLIVVIAVGLMVWEPLAAPTPTADAQVGLRPSTTRPRRTAAGYDHVHDTRRLPRPTPLWNARQLARNASRS